MISGGALVMGSVFMSAGVTYVHGFCQCGRSELRSCCGHLCLSAGAAAAVAGGHCRSGGCACGCSCGCCCGVAPCGIHCLRGLSAHHLLSGCPAVPPWFVSATKAFERLTPFLPHCVLSLCRIAPCSECPFLARVIPLYVKPGQFPPAQ